tara:strand:- start:449 stop:769 length:321 start_codon:yes stop_codon:yes gene_type:complete
MRRAISVNEQLLCKTWSLFTFAERKMTSHDLADELQISTRTAYKWVRTIHEFRLIYICGWKADSIGRLVTPIYAAGNLMDKPRQKRTTLDRRRAYKIKMEIARADK